MGLYMHESFLSNIISTIVYAETEGCHNVKNARFYQQSSTYFDLETFHLNNIIYSAPITHLVIRYCMLTRNHDQDLDYFQNAVRSKMNDLHKKSKGNSILEYYCLRK